MLLDPDRNVITEPTGKTDHMRSSTDTSFSKLEHVVTTISMMSDYMDETKNDSTMEDRTTEQYCTVDGTCVDAPTKIVRNTNITKIMPTAMSRRACAPAATTETYLQPSILAASHFLSCGAMPYNFLMGRLFYLAAAFAAAGCGKVAAIPDGPPVDVVADALSCSAPKTACDDKCVNTTTDSMNCGECGVECGAETTCANSHCIEATLSCANIHAVDPTMPSGPYTHVADNHQFFCDMDGGPMQYEELGFGQASVAHAGWDFVGAADMAQPTIQKAFIFLFNKQAGGLTLIASFVATSGNCCMKASNTAGLDLEIGGGVVFPATTNTAGSQCFITYSAATYGFVLTNGTIGAISPMADDFFTAHPFTEVAAGCTDNLNPAMFFRRHL